MRYAATPFVLSVLMGYVVNPVIVVWALIESARLRRWRWVVTILVLQFVGAVAWFVAARRQYRLAVHAGDIPPPAGAGWFVTDRRRQPRS